MEVEAYLDSDESKIKSYFITSKETQTLWFLSSGKLFWCSSGRKMQGTACVSSGKFVEKIFQSNFRTLKLKVAYSE